MRRLGDTLIVVIRVIGIIAIIVIGIFAYSTCAGGHIVQKIDRSMEKFQVQGLYPVYTQTHVYYTSKALTNEDKSVTMYGWYEQDGKAWVYHEETHTIKAFFKPHIGERLSSAK